MSDVIAIPAPHAEGPPLVWFMSGMSGAGKATALRALEASDVECVDNLPVDLMNGFSALPQAGIRVGVIDARQHEHLEGFEAIPATRVLFLDARDDVLVRRLADSTRPHPCADHGRGLGAVQAERALLEPVRAAADVVIDTSDLTPQDLAQRVLAIVVPDGDGSRASIRLTVSSFGFKYGPQLDCDWVVDVRMMANPFWVPELRPLTGLDQPVREFVMQQHEAKELLHRLHQLLHWSVPLYQDHRRRFLHVALGCTGGRHRSVVLAEALARQLQDNSLDVDVWHRDVARPDPRD